MGSKQTVICGLYTPFTAYRSLLRVHIWTLEMENTMTKSLKAIRQETSPLTVLKVVMNRLQGSSRGLGYWAAVDSIPHLVARNADGRTAQELRKALADSRKQNE